MQVQHSSEKLQHYSKLIEKVAATSPNMSEATAPTLQELFVQRSVVDEKIRTAQREKAGLKFDTLSNGQNFRSVLSEVLALIVLSDVTMLKRGLVQRAVPEKANLYSLVISNRITADILTLIPPRRELQEVFGDVWVCLVFPVGQKLSTAIPKMQSLLKAAIEFLSSRKQLEEAAAEIQDCHLQLQYTSVPFSATAERRGRKRKLSDFELEKIALLKSGGISNVEILEVVNSDRAMLDYPPVGLTSIKEVPCAKKSLVENRAISDQKEACATKSASGLRGGCAVFEAAPQALPLTARTAFDDLADELPFDPYIPKPSALEQKYQRKFDAWLTGKNMREERGVSESHLA